PSARSPLWVFLDEITQRKFGKFRNIDFAIFPPANPAFTDVEQKAKLGLLQIHCYSQLTKLLTGHYVLLRYVGANIKPFCLTCAKPGCVCCGLVQRHFSVTLLQPRNDGRPFEAWRDSGRAKIVNTALEDSRSHLILDRFRLELESCCDFS